LIGSQHLYQHCSRGESFPLPSPGSEEWLVGMPNKCTTPPAWMHEIDHSGVWALPTSRLNINNLANDSWRWRARPHRALQKTTFRPESFPRPAEPRPPVSSGRFWRSRCLGWRCACRPPTEPPARFAGSRSRSGRSRSRCNRSDPDSPTRRISFADRIFVPCQ